MTAADREAPVIAASSLGTAWLVQLALTLPVSASVRNELYGRDRAYWAIGHGHEAARRWIHAQPEPEQRRAAARALAMAGHQLADLGRIPAGMSLAALAAWDGGTPADREALRAELHGRLEAARGGDGPSAAAGQLAAAAGLTRRHVLRFAAGDDDYGDSWVAALAAALATEGTP